MERITGHMADQHDAPTREDGEIGPYRHVMTAQRSPERRAHAQGIPKSPFLVFLCAL